MWLNFPQSVMSFRIHRSCSREPLTVRAVHEHHSIIFTSMLHWTCSAIKLAIVTVVPVQLGDLWPVHSDSKAYIQSDFLLQAQQSPPAGHQADPKPTSIFYIQSMVCLLTWSLSRIWNVLRFMGKYGSGLAVRPNWGQHGVIDAYILTMYSWRFTWTAAAPRRYHCFFQWCCPWSWWWGRSPELSTALECRNQNVRYVHRPSFFSKYQG